ncbi:NAD(P)H-hydrate dehydratase [Ideonella sp.]|uniref:NAD(P)H-hydrate dehydratase n=1 Tax=Ideonella sp. TaxID=1929293 RepID=UPI002E330435|nr:NAD(P)H-hydrate dehydratase [Ideonella sp.]
MNGPCRLLPGDTAALLYDSAASRAIEQAALADAPAHGLMERAGLAVARLALSIAPHARHIWIAAGPGNNGGDGLVAARWLHAAGKSVHVTCTGDPDRLPPDAAHARHQALLAGVALHGAIDWPVADQPAPDLVIDALLGLGQRRGPEGEMAETIRALQACRRRGAAVLAVDLPTGLCADTGRQLGEVLVQADATLALLTPKPGLFSGQGRDASGQVWWDGLGAAPGASLATARLSNSTDARIALGPRLAAPHASHKGHFGDVWVVGGAPGMQGAAQLAARASLRAGAGRVYVSALDGGLPQPPTSLELMQRPWHDARTAGWVEHATVVCGCGGGDAVRKVLPELISRAHRLVLDADALNCIATDSALAIQLETRGRRGAATVMTPHPLEAARLLATDTAGLQADRLRAAQALADRFGAVVVLKGSGSVVAAPGRQPVINASGNARLATAGTGDVLAGWIGGCWSSHGNDDVLAVAAQVAVGSTWLHGRAVETHGAALPLPAGQLIDAMVEAADALR